MINMETVNYHDGALEFSPNGLFVASASRLFVTIRSLKSFHKTNIFKCSEVVEAIVWSPNSELIACRLRNKTTVEVFSTTYTDMCCQITELISEIIHLCWSADSNHILIADNVRLGIWTIGGTSVAFIVSPKRIKKWMDLSPCGRYLAVITFNEGKDVVSIYDTEDPLWVKVVTFEVFTRYADGLKWSPDGRYIAIWDIDLYDKVSIVSADGRPLHSYEMKSSETPDENHNHGLYIKKVQWAPLGQLLFICGHDGKMCILQTTTWSCLAVLFHPLNQEIDPFLRLSSPTGQPRRGPRNGNRPMRTQRIAIYREWRTDDSAPTATRVDVCFAGTTKCEGYESIVSPITIGTLNPDPQKPNPKMGIDTCIFSPTGRFVATRLLECARTLWIWSLGEKISLVSILDHEAVITSVAWDSNQASPRLALATARGRVFLWTPHGVLALALDQHRLEFPVTLVAWSPTGEALLLRSKREFLVSSLDADPSSIPDASAWKVPALPGGRKPLMELDIRPPGPGRASDPPLSRSPSFSNAGGLPSWASSSTDARPSTSPLNLEKDSSDTTGNVIVCTRGRRSSSCSSSMRTKWRL